MKSKAIKSLYVLLTLTLLTSLIPIFHYASAQTKPSIFIAPHENTFYTDETAVGANFTISVSSADWVAPGVFGYEFKVTYDPSQLEAVAAEIPTGHWLTPSLKPGNIFVVDGGTIDDAAGTVSFATALLSPELGKTGGGVIATVTFTITTAPPAGGNLTSTIGLSGLILVDPNASPIDPATYDVIPGLFAFAAPPPPWYLKVDPPLVAASAVGDTVTVSIDLFNAQASGAIVGIQFRLLYPSVLTTTEDGGIVEGGFFKSLGDTAFTAFVEPDAQGNPSVIAFVFLLPSSDTGTWSVFPDGNGTLATITFTVASVPAELTTLPLTLTDVIIVGADGNVLPYRRLEDATLLIPALSEDINGDGVVNILDMALWAKAFGAVPGQDRYDAKADVNRDGRINIIDGVLIAKKFGFVVA